MNIGNLITFYRRNEKLTQKSIYQELENFSKSTFLRTESNEREPTINEIESILSRLSITIEEFVAMCDLDKEQRDFSNKIENCQKNPNKNNMNELIEYFNKINDSNEKTLREITNYFSIKRAFGEDNRIGRVTKEEIKEISEYLTNRKFYTYYDYSLLLNLAPYFNHKQATSLFYKAFPISMIEKRTPRIIDFSIHASLSFIYARIYQKDKVKTTKNEIDKYFTARKFIDFAEKRIETNDLRFKIELKILAHLVDYLEFDKPEDASNLFYYVDFFKRIEETEKVIMLEKEIQKLHITKDKDIDIWNNDFPTYKV